MVFCVKQWAIFWKHNFVQIPLVLNSFPQIKTKSQHRDDPLHANYRKLLFIQGQRAHYIIKKTVFLCADMQQCLMFNAQHTDSLSTSSLWNVKQLTLSQDYKNTYSLTMPYYLNT
jgi:hypothetical protein